MALSLRDRIEDLNWNEKGLHRLMGWWWNLTARNTKKTAREIASFPPENRKNPVLWVARPEGVSSTDLHVTEHPGIAHQWRGDGIRVSEYWAATRVRDTVKDLHDMNIGANIAWPFIFGLGVLAGWILL